MSHDIWVDLTLILMKKERTNTQAGDRERKKHARSAEGARTAAVQVCNHSIGSAGDMDCQPLEALDNLSSPPGA